MTLIHRSEPCNPVAAGPAQRPARGPRWARAALALLSAGIVWTLLTTVVSAQVRLPAMGESVSASMPLGAERRLGDQIWVEVRRDPTWLDDPVLTQYLQDLWWPLIEAAARRGEIGEDMRQQFAWEAFLIRDRSINAFALPGGYVGMHLGLIASTTTRHEMVSVMAHELSHVTQRHIARSIESAGRQSAVGIAAMLLGMIAASRSGNADVARAAIAGGQAAMIQGQLNFSRDMEREADRIGHALMIDAGFAAAGMPAMFDKLDKANRLNDAGNFPYLRSHPLTVERIAEAQSRAGAATPALQPSRSDEEHELMRARARVLMDPAVTALRAHVEVMQTWSAQRPLPLDMAYAAALSAVLLKNDAQARQALQHLSRAPGAAQVTRWVQLLHAEAALTLPSLASAKPIEPAAPVKSGADSAQGWARPELIIGGRAVLARAQAGQPQGAALGDLHQALRARLVRHPSDATLWEMLAECESLKGNRLAMMRATAEAHLAVGKGDAAMVTLQAARNSARGSADADGVELAVIDARLAELRRQRQQQRDARDGRDSRNDRAERSDRSELEAAP